MVQTILLTLQAQLSTLNVKSFQRELIFLVVAVQLQ